MPQIVFYKLEKGVNRKKIMKLGFIYYSDEYYLMIVGPIIKL